MTEPSKKALDYAAREAGYDNYEVMTYHKTHSTHMSIIAHAKTLDELWVIKPPKKTQGELFADEMMDRGEKCSLDYLEIAAEMIDEGWEPKYD